MNEENNLVSGASLMSGFGPVEFVPSPSACMNGRPPIVSLRTLVKRFGSTVAVDNVSLDIGEGEFVTFLGSSGSGKTTTLSIVAGFEDPTSGDVLVDNQSILNVPPHKRNIGMVFQRYTLFPHLNVFENVAFPLSVRHRPKAEIEAAVTEALRLVRLEAFGERRPNQLSGGQQQRVALARALVYRPRFLLMDEPLAALDKRLREEIQQEIRRIHQETGVTVLYVTHDQEEALRLSDRIAVFSHGRIEQIGTGADLYDAPKSAFVGGFVGNSNFISCTVAESTGDCCGVRMPGGQICIIQRPLPVPSGSAVSLMLRPERMALSDAAPDAGPDCAIRVRIREVTFLGESIYYTVVTEWGQSLAIRAFLGSSQYSPFTSGAEVFARWHSRDAHLFAT